MDFRVVADCWKTVSPPCQRVRKGSSNTTLTASISTEQCNETQTCAKLCNAVSILPQLCFFVRPLKNVKAPPCFFPQLTGRYVEGTQVSHQRLPFSHGFGVVSRCLGVRGACPSGCGMPIGCGDRVVEWRSARERLDWPGFRRL